jgi:hypothetical protein
VEFESPTWLPRALRALAHEAVVTEDGSHLLDELGTVAATLRASSFSPAVPPACHNERSPAVSSGQSRSMPEGGLGRLTASDLGWGRSAKLHGMQGVIVNQAWASGPSLRWFDA